MAASLYIENNILSVKPQEQTGGSKSTNSKTESAGGDFENILGSLQENSSATEEKNTDETTVETGNTEENTANQETQTPEETTIPDIALSEQQTISADNTLGMEYKSDEDDAEETPENSIVIEAAAVQNIEALAVEVKKSEDKTPLMPKTEPPAEKVISETAKTAETEIDDTSTDLTGKIDIEEEVPEEDLNNLVKVEDNIDADDTVVTEKSTKQADEKTSAKVNQQMLDDMETTIKTISVQSDSSSFSSGSGSKSNAQEDAIKYTIKGLESQLTAPGQNETNSIQNAFDKTLNAASAKEAPKSDIMSQINSKLTTLKDESVSKVNIVLKPESLGKVNIEIMSSKDGITARISAQTPEARDILNKNIESLKTTMQAQGVNVNNVSVRVEETQSSSQNSLNSEQEAFNKQFSEERGQTSERQKQSIAAQNTADSITAEDADTEEAAAFNHNGSISISV